jgi:hypothetical protein
VEKIFQKIKREKRKGNHHFREIEQGKKKKEKQETHF